MRKTYRTKPYTNIFVYPPITDNRETSLNNNIPSGSTPQIPNPIPYQNQIFDSLRLPDAVKDLPKFDGNPRLLYLINVDGTNYAKIILRSIRNKIVGQANEVLNVYGTPLVWENIKSNLILHYSNKRNETSLIKDLHNLKKTNQSVQHSYSSII